MPLRHLRLLSTLFFLLVWSLSACGDAPRLRAGGGEKQEKPVIDMSPFSVDLADRNAAKNGRRLFMKRGCATCHDVKSGRRLLGPSLAGVRDRLIPEEIRQWIRDPKSIRSETKMPPLAADASPEEAELLTAYLLKLKAPVDPTATALAEALGSEAKTSVKLEDPAAIRAGFGIYRRLCLQCHPAAGSPVNEHQLALQGVGSRRDADTLRRWVRDPASQKPGTSMPPWRGSDADLERVVAYLLSLKDEGK